MMVRLVKPPLDNVLSLSLEASLYSGDNLFRQKKKLLGDWI